MWLIGGWVDLMCEGGIWREVGSVSICGCILEGSEGKSVCPR